MRGERGEGGGLLEGIYRRGYRCEQVKLFGRSTSQVQTNNWLSKGSNIPPTEDFG